VWRRNKMYPLHQMGRRRRVPFRDKSHREEERRRKRTY